jgi:hypothetical protein
MKSFKTHTVTKKQNSPSMAKGSITSGSSKKETPPGNGVQVALYDMIDKLHKQLEERFGASRQLEATLRHRCEKLRIHLTETHFERETAIRLTNIACVFLQYNLDDTCTFDCPLRHFHIGFKSLLKYAKVF